MSPAQWGAYLKTALVTFYHIHHYGAQFQAAATVRAVKALGSECEIVNYYVNQDNALYRKPTSPSALLSDAHTTLHHHALKTRYDRFEAFAAQFLPTTSRRFESLEDIRQNCPPYDAYLSGSDQIWNPKIFPDGHFDPVFFSAFTQGRKISYAPSFGIPEIPTGMEEELKGYLDSFSALSVRERQGQRIVRKASGLEAQVVLDPTLLLRREDWQELAAPPVVKGKYILVYCISKPGPLEHYIRQLAAQTGLPVVQLCGLRRKTHPKAKCVLDAGPAEFLSLFANAAYVCTNSFHGTVFSVQFGKPFFTAVAPMELAEPEHSRTHNLLSTLGLTDRIIGKGDTADLLAEIDYDAVNRRLEAERQTSLDWLRTALTGESAPAADAVPAEPVEDAVPAEAPADTAPDRPLLAAPNDCTGCAACRNACPVDAISMQPDKEGFLYPAVDLTTCLHCGKCTATCPILRPLEPPTYMPAVFAAWNRDDTIRRDSTSGGVFSALADYVFEDGGAVFGAMLDDHQRVKHIACFRKDALRYLRGAKYVQSDIGETYREVAKLLKSRPVLFSGTPCQVDGLYRYLGSRPDNLLTCDIICHGVPSPQVWDDLIRSVEATGGKQVRSVRFRNKVNGWKNSHFTITFDGGGVFSKPLMQTEFGRGFGRALFLRPSCYRCPYASLSRPGDFTLGDFWGLREDELAEEQRLGVGLLLINTQHGSHVFDQLPIAKVPYPVERAIAGNPRLSSPTPMQPERGAFFAAYALEPFEQVRKKYLRLPPLYYRAASKVLTPELKEKIRKKLR